MVAAEIALEGLGPVIADVESSSETSVTVLDESDIILFNRPGSELVGDSAADLPLVIALRDAPSGTDVIDDGPDGVERIYTADLVSDPDGSMVLAGISTDAAFAESDRWLRYATPDARVRDDPRPCNRIVVRASLGDPPRP